MNNHDNSAEKLSLLAQLVQLARADEEVKEIEFNFLRSIAEQLNISMEEFRLVFEQYIAFEPPAFEFDRIVQLHRLVLLMNIDQELDATELFLIKDLGIKLGLHPLAVEEILSVMHEYENKMLPPERLISIFQTFHN